MTKIKHIIWDWNGTLVNDGWLFVELMNLVLEKRNLPKITLSDYKNTFCFPLEKYYQRLGFNFNKESYLVPSLEFIKLYDNMGFRKAPWQKINNHGSDYTVNNIINTDSVYYDHDNIPLSLKHATHYSFKSSQKLCNFSYYNLNMDISGVDISNNFIELNAGWKGDVDNFDSGIIINRGISGEDNEYAVFGWDAPDNRFILGTSIHDKLFNSSGDETLHFRDNGNDSFDAANLLCGDISCNNINCKKNIGKTRMCKGARLFTLAFCFSVVARGEGATLHLYICNNFFRTLAYYSISSKGLMSTF